MIDHTIKYKSFLDKCSQQIFIIQKKIEQISSNIWKYFSFYGYLNTFDKQLKI